MLFCPECDWNNSDYPEASYCPNDGHELVEVSLVVEPKEITFKDIYFGEPSPQKVRISISRSDGKEVKASGHIKDGNEKGFEVKQISDNELLLICHPKYLKQKKINCSLEITDESSPLRESIPVEVSLITSKIEATVRAPSKPNFISVAIKNIGQEELKLHSFSFKSKPSKAIRRKPDLLKPQEDKRFHVRIPASLLQRFALGKKEEEDILVIRSNDAEQPEFELQSPISVKPWLTIRKILFFLIAPSVVFSGYLIHRYVPPITKDKDKPPSISAPEINNIKPINGSFISDATSTISAEVKDKTSGVDEKSVTMKIDGKKVNSFYNPEKGIVSYKPDIALSEGEHKVIIEASNKAGNKAKKSFSFTIDTIAPEISNVTPSDGSLLNDAVPIISAEVKDETSGVDERSIIMEVDGRRVSSSYSWGIVIYKPGIALSEWEHTITIEASDKAGNKKQSKSRMIVSKSLSLNSSNNGIVGHTTKENWWKLSVPKAGVLTVKLSGAQPSDNLDIALYGKERAEPPITISTSIGNGLEELKETIKEPGTYYVKVYMAGITNDSSYTISATFIGLGEYYLQKGIESYNAADWDECISQLSESLKYRFDKQNDLLNAHQGLAVAYFSKRDIEKVKEHFREILRVEPEYDKISIMNFSDEFVDIFNNVRSEFPFGRTR